jgi:hypothetical protein
MFWGFWRVGVRQGFPPDSSHEPPPSADEVDAQRKEAIKAKVGEVPEGNGSQEEHKGRGPRESRPLGNG